MINRLKVLVDRLEIEVERAEMDVYIESDFIYYSLELLGILESNEYFDIPADFVALEEHERVVKEMQHFVKRYEVEEEIITRCLYIFDEVFKDNKEVKDVCYYIDQELDEPMWPAEKEVKEVDSKDELANALKNVDWDKIAKEYEKALRDGVGQRLFEEKVRWDTRGINLIII